MEGSRMEDEAWLKVGVAAILARQYAEHQRGFAESLARMLERALPEQVRVTRRRSLFAREQPIQELRLELGDVRYALECPKQGAPIARRVLVKRGIILRTEILSVPEWITEVGNALEEHAQRNEQAASALRQFTE
jgi:hypothetical protein